MVTSVGTVAGRGQVPMQREISRLEIQKAIARLKCGKDAGMDGITAEMLKYGGDLDRLYDWARKWQMELNIGKCSVMSAGRNNPLHNYSLNDTP